MARIDWAALEPEILRAIGELEERGFLEPTVRAVYYILSDSYGLIPGTGYGYKKLDAKVVELRRRGEIPWGFFAVKRGRSRLASRYWDPEAYAKYLVEEARKAHETYSVPRWRHQRTHVEVWVEKDGLLGATWNFLRDLDVTVRAPQGYGAWEFVREAVLEMAEDLEGRPNVEAIRILYLGDLDPSGKDIPRFLREDPLPEFAAEEGIEARIDWEDVALSPAQVREYGLPDSPESPETLRKIRDDPRYRWYVRGYGTVFCELDSFYAEATEAARDLVRGAVERVFDEELHRQTEEEELEGRRAVRDEIRRRVTFHDEGNP